MNQANAYRIYLFSQFAAAFCTRLVFPVSLVYQAQAAQLNPLQLVLVGTTLEVTAFLFQIPTGIIADVYSRRLSVVLGYLLIGLGLGLVGVFPLFSTILLAQVISGIGYTMVDGALEAWVADELGEQNAGSAYLRAAQLGNLGALAGLVISAVLASWMLNLPILLGGAMLVLLSGFLALRMPENGFTPTPRENRNSWQQMGHTFKQGILLARGKPVVITILAIAVIQGAFSEGFDRLWTPHLLNNITLPPLGPFQPVVWFNLISAMGTVLALGATEVIRRRVDTNRHAAVARALLTVTTGLLVAMLAFALTSNLTVAVIALLAINMTRSAASPLSTAWLNQSLAPQVRATLFSVWAQMDALGQIIGGPLLGALATGVSLPAALALAGLLLLPVLALYAWTLRGGETLIVDG
ncbi:MAG: MFS transporter [Anaerolineae bacterium]